MINFSFITAKQFLILMGLALLLLTIAALIYSWDDIKRYWKMRQM